MHSLGSTIDYLEEFFTSKYPLYFEMMKDAGRSGLRPPNFEDEDIVIQYIRNVVHNIGDNYCDLSIPAKYATPDILLTSLEQLRNMAEEQYVATEDIFQAAGGKNFDAISYSRQINYEVKEAIQYALTLADQKPPTAVATNRLAKILGKLPKVARELLDRRSSNSGPRPTLEVNDEYDLQDLLRALLFIEFEDVRKEEWCPSYAGSSRRMDFLLKKEKIVVEVKKTRPDHNDRKIGEELTIDIANYQHHSDCELLLCYIWDRERKISNPEGLISDIETSNKRFVKVLIYQ